MFRSFQPVIERLENREVFSAGPLAGGLAAAPTHDAWNWGVNAEIAGSRTETVDNNETITRHVQPGKATHGADLLLTARQTAGAHDAVFAELGQGANDPQQIIAILIGMARAQRSRDDLVGMNFGASAIHAEKNQDIEVENDETHWVGRDRQLASVTDLVMDPVNARIVGSQEYFNLHARR